METLLVRLRPFDPRRGNVLRRYTYGGIRFQAERGWYRVEKAVAEYLRTVHQVPGDDHTPLAFDVYTEDEAKAVEARDSDAAKQKRSATDDLKVVMARPAAASAVASAPVTTPAPAPRDDDKDPRRARRDRE